MTTTSTRLTQSQMMIWMGQEMSPSEPLYNMILTFDINGELDVPRFKKAFQKLLDHNDVLRSFIELRDDIPVQVFYDQMDSPLEFIDFSGSADAYQEYLNWVEDNKGRQFGTKEILYHAVLFKITENKYILYLNKYHLITDGWAIKYVYDELNGYYRNFEGTDTELVQKDNNFQSYAQNNPFQYKENIIPYWQNKLDKAQMPPSLYGTAITNGSSKSTRINFDMGMERTRKLKELTIDADFKAWTTELALSNIFLTVMNALVYKVGNQDDFTVGLPYHNRLGVREKKTAGLFMELLPMNISVEKEDTLLDLFIKTKNESLEVIKNTMVGKPPIKLLKTFNVVMNFIPTTFGDFAGMPMECRWLLSDHVDPNHHIRLQIQDFNNIGDYKLQFDLNNEVFSENQVNYVGRHFIQIVDALIEDKHKKIKELQLITEAEVQKIEKWNSTSIDYDKDETLLSKFGEQVERTPNDIALLFREKSLTYLELDEKSNQVARFLIQKGVRRNDIIAISLERSLGMMVYIYGILKAGAAYLPIDILTPVERMKFILENARVKTLFFNHNQISVANFGTTKCYQLESIAGEVTVLDTKNPLVEVNPNDLAYVIYTSGSTGEPKGVKCHHRGICNRLNWMNNDYPISGNDIFLQKTPITFDVSVWELFWPLQVGAKLVVEIPEGHLDPDGLVRTIVDQKVTVVHFVPSMLNVIMETKGVENCVSLKRIFCSGEALSVASVEKTHTKLDVEIYNLYGPTEASVDVSSWHCKRNDVQESIPIGYPVANTRLYILDEAMNQVPIGVGGELYIAGAQVAHGYLNNQELTDERFVKDIFSNSVNARMYRTGDLARYRGDGAIDYLGRTDTQIKLRGLRIELGEIEKTLEKHIAISQVVVKVGEKENNQEYLLAYYTGRLVEDNELINLLEKSLPLYMIPSFFIHLEKFEFLSSGKIDRKKLPEHSIKKVQETKLYLAPTNEFEEIIADTWIEIMQIGKVGIDENFIQLGGNSLNAMVVTSRLKTAFELDLPITLVFNYPTVKTYADYVEKRIIELMKD